MWTHRWTDGQMCRNTDISTHRCVDPPRGQFVNFLFSGEIYELASNCHFFDPKSTHICFFGDPIGRWYPKIDPGVTKMDPRVDQCGSKSSICRHIDGPMDICPEIPIYRPSDMSTRRGADVSNICLRGTVWYTIRR